MQRRVAADAMPIRERWMGSKKYLKGEKRESREQKEEEERKKSR